MACLTELDTILKLHYEQPQRHCYHKMAAECFCDVSLHENRPNFCCALQFPIAVIHRNMLDIFAAVQDWRWFQHIQRPVTMTTQRTTC